MAKIRNQYYRYNPETDDFERVFPTFGRRLATFGRYALVSLIVGACLFLVAWYAFDSPGEKELRVENALLKQQYAILNRRLDNSQKVMDNLRNRDDNFYRVILKMDPMPDAQRSAGVNSEKRYRELGRMSDGGLIKFLTQRVDLLERQIYAQSLSLDQIKEDVEKNHDNLDLVPSILPVPGGMDHISGGFGLRRSPIGRENGFHPGIDFAVKEGQPVYATADGVVKTSERRGNHGNMVEIEHGDQYMTRYSHLQGMSVSAGTHVKRGDKIGTVGNTGRSTAPHLHYEVRFKGEPQNPANYAFRELNPEQYAEMVRRVENAGEIMD